MTTHSHDEHEREQGLYPNITLLDVQLASAFYPILVDHARGESPGSTPTITYEQLAEIAKARNPDKPEIQRAAIAIGVGRRLDVVRMFTNERQLPDLTSLVVSKTDGECGSGFTRHFDPIAAREQVRKFDWTGVTRDFDGFVTAATAKVRERSASKAPSKIKEPAARQLMADYFTEHKASLPAAVRKQRERIIQLIMQGVPVAESFSKALDQQTR